MPSVSPTLLAVLTIGIVALILGIIIGSYTMPPNLSDEDQTKINLVDRLTENHYLGRDDKIVKSIIDEVNRDSIRDKLKFLSSEPHLPGTPQDQQLAYYMRDEFIKQGLDRAYLVPYKVLLSYSNKTHPNKVNIIDKDGNILFTSQHQEPQLQDQTDQTEKTLHFIDSYNSFSPKADVTGDPVYCNYGREKDFDLLEEKANIDLKGKICIIKYGKIFRGNKCDNAVKRGCAGVILFTDPIDMAREGTKAENVYPNSWWMNGYAMQRGNIGSKMGDVLTPGFPSLIDGAFHYDPKDVELPKIPSQPIGYEDAHTILKNMGGMSANTPEFHDWNGGLNVTYKLGPGFDAQNADKKLRLVVNNYMERKIIYNVIGILEGSVERDRYVILGNHRDAWGYGAVDAASGGASLLEVTRVFGSLHTRQHWRPRRTMLFASWTAEEFGLIGSTEWVEEWIDLLSQRAIAYINVDYCIKGPHFAPDASPTLMKVLRDVTHDIPYNTNTTLFNAWNAYQQQFTENQNIKTPKVRTLGSGTDHASFAFFAGIPSINVDFTYDKLKYPISGYPAYHTRYDTFYLVDNFIDPGFSLHQCCSRLMAILMHSIAGSTLLVYDFVELAQHIQNDYQSMRKGDAFKAILESEQINRELIEMLEKSIANFSSAAKQWKDSIEKVDVKNPLEVRQMNDRMMGVERAFIKAEGLYERPEIKHVLYAPFRYDKYSRKAFPGVLDLLHKIAETKRKDESKAYEYWKLMRRHISDIAIMLRSATNLLRDKPL